MVLISTKCLYFSFFFLSCFTCMVLISTKCSTLRSTCARTAASTNAHSSEETAITGLYFFFSFVFSLHIHERTFVKETAITGLYFFFSFFLFFTHPRTHIRQKRPTCKQKRDPLISLEKKRTYLYASKETYQHRHT